MSPPVCKLVSGYWGLCSQTIRRVLYFTGVFTRFNPPILIEQKRGPAPPVAARDREQNGILFYSLALSGRIFVFRLDGHFDLCTLLQTDFFTVSV